MLRKVLYHIADLPAQTAHTLFNYLVGVGLASDSEGQLPGRCCTHQVILRVNDLVDVALMG